ncbi:hypothetical protein HYQ46_006191 [Verticillium longisporum]|nr:hypothetical protein HYQ46_006191 [Verticillium longisporum]
MRLAASIIAAAQNTEDGKETLDRQVEAFEKEMFPRMEKVQRLTDELMHDYFHTPGVPQSIMARVLTRHVKLSTPAVLHPLATLGVHGYLFWNSLASRWR